MFTHNSTHQHIICLNGYTKIIILLKGIHFFYKSMYGLALVKTLKFKPANKNKYVRMGWWWWAGFAIVIKKWKPYTVSAWLMTPS